MIRPEPSEQDFADADKTLEGRLTDDPAHTREQMRYLAAVVFQLRREVVKLRRKARSGTDLPDGSEILSSIEPDGTLVIKRAKGDSVSTLLRISERPELRV